MTDAHIEQLLAIFDRRTLAKGAALFERGEVADRLLLLVSGEVLVTQGSESFRLRPIAPVGELGALCGFKRTSTATAATSCDVLTISMGALMRFFEAHGDVAYPFHHNLLHVVADKLSRDKRRLDEMRANIIETQKSLKRMHDALLAAPETELSRLLFEEIDALIEQNKKSRYLVAPTRSIPTRVRFDDGEQRNVAWLSNEWLMVARSANGEELERGAELSCVLIAPELEIPVSGIVDAVTDEHVAVTLDPLIREYAADLERHLVRLQMLDVVL